MGITVTFNNLQADDATRLMCFYELLSNGNVEWAEQNLVDSLLSVLVHLEGYWGELEKKYPTIPLSERELPEDQQILINCIWKIATCDFPELREMIQQLHKLEYVRPAE